MRIRRQKLDELYEQGINPYGDKFERTHLAQDIIDNFDQLEESETKIAGRIMTMRTHGKASFAHVADASGRIQIYIRVNRVGEEKYELFKSWISAILSRFTVEFSGQSGEKSVLRSMISA